MLRLYDESWLFWALANTVVIMIVCRLIAMYQSEYMTFYYKKDGSLMSEFMEKSGITKMRYTPYLFALHAHLQGFCFLPYSLAQEGWESLRMEFERELFKLEDGQDIALEWAQGKPKAGDNRPILMCVGGLGGGNQVGYVKSVIKTAEKKGFKCVYVLFRGAGGLPLTTGKIYSLLSVGDIKEPTDYIHKTYCKDTGKNMYLYACSLGAAMSTHYLLENAETTPIKGAAFYGTPLCTGKSGKFFQEFCFGLYDTALGVDVNMKIRAHLPQIRKYSTDAQNKSYERGLYQESWRLSDIDNYVIAPMFGHKDKQDYWNKGTIAGNLHKLTKVPCFYLHANDDIVID